MRTQGDPDLLWWFITKLMKERRIGPALFAEVKTAGGLAVASRAFLGMKLTVVAIGAVETISPVTDRARRIIVLNLTEC